MVDFGTFRLTNFYMECSCIAPLTQGNEHELSQQQTLVHASKEFLKSLNILHCSPTIEIYNVYDLSSPSDCKNIISFTKR